jgi:hypothetical protein
MAVNLSPVGGVAAQFFDNSGNVLTGGKIYTYTAGTTTNQATYTSATGVTAHSNPIILDASGRVPSGEIWLTDGLSYKFLIKTSTEVLIGSYDNIAGINSNFINFLTETEIQTATAGQTVFTLTTMDYQPGTNSLSVFVDGVNQYDGVTYAYVETNSTTVTFSAGLHVGALVKFTTAQTLSSGVTDASLVVYDPPFTGSVPTTVQAKLEQEFSTIDFGDTDGVGTVTLNVPAEYTTIQDAFDFLANKSIVAGTTVTIKVADGTYTLATGINGNHPQGSQIRLIGNETTPANCVITVSGVPTFDALSVSNGHTLGYVNGFKFELAAKATLTNNWTAILANNGATIICGPELQTNNWYYGIAARNGSYISCNYAQVDNAGDVGIWAFVGSTVEARFAISNNASDVTNNFGWGFEAEYGSSLDCSNGSASGCLRGGVGSLSNSNVRALNFTANTNTGSGFYAQDGGTIECHNSTANNNTRYGIEQIGSSRILGTSLTLTGNTIAAVKPIAALDNDILGPRLNTPNGGALRIDGSDGVFFHSDNGLQFIAALGPANTVNQLLAEGSATGDPVELAAVGSDAIIDISLRPKGNGSFIKLGAGFFSTADTPVIGYIQIKDNTGTIRKLAVVA